MYSQKRKQHHVETDQLTQLATDEKHHHIQNQIRNNRKKLFDQSNATGQPNLNFRHHSPVQSSDNNSTCRTNSETPDQRLRKHLFRNQIRAGLRSLVTFPMKQIKALFGDGVA